MHLILNWTPTATPISDFEVDKFVGETIKMLILTPGIQTIDVCNALVVDAFRVQRLKGMLNTLVISYKSDTGVSSNFVDDNGRYEKGYPHFIPCFSKMEDYLIDIL